ncbi:probable E3 ubiquitin-protein ligase HERC3 isoform X2 [Parambassis ranga]|nr:probable E3 ubiquitin-protein ligase HERC3 isoform X2 [Parambassis ranga]
MLLSEGGKVFCVDTTNTPFKPICPDALCSIHVCQVACGSQHTVILTKDGQVYTWGQDSRGQLGLGKKESGPSSPQHLRSLSAIPVVRVAAGGEQSFALSVSGGVFGWGRNDRGQLGLGHTKDRHTPAPVHALNMKKTTDISCGTDHTAILTKHGAVFTFGSGQYGQLGHNSFRNELRPRLVAELWGSKVTKIACGRYHTLVLTDANRVYSFGCDEQGQLGHGEDSHPAVPLAVQLPQDTTDGQIIQNIYAGGDSSFANCTAGQQDMIKSVTAHSVDAMMDRWPSEPDSKSIKTIKQMCFSSASCLNQSFLDQSKDKHYQTSPKFSGLDLSLAQQGFQKLVRTDAALAEVEASVLQLLPSLDVAPVGVEGLRIFLLLTELLHVIKSRKGPNNTKLAEAVAAAMQRLYAVSLQIIGNWWSSLYPSAMVRHVKVWTEALSVILSFNPVPRNSAKNMLLILQTMYNANRSKKIPESTFYTKTQQTFLQEDLWRWRLMLKNKCENDLPLIIGSFTFVMDLNSKKWVFDTLTAWTQDEHQESKMVYMWPNWCPQPDYFKLSLRRASLLEDTFSQLAAAPQSTLKKPLVVYFDEDPKITNVYMKDFFHHLFHELVSAESELFMLNDSQTLAWFPSRETTEEDRLKYRLFGVLCGLALYNMSIIHLPFPLVLFKKLLNEEPTLEDMMEFSPRDGQSLQCILDYEDDVIDNLYIDFLMDWNGKKVDLDPENPGKPLTSQNKKEFVDAFINHAFNTSVQRVFQEFQRGFFQVCERDLVLLFRPKELQGLLVGQNVYDWAKLKQNTLYDGYYHPGHPTIRMFWEVFDELTEDQRKDFLWFLTGFRMVPIFGMGQIQMKVRVKQIHTGSYDQHFPESLTCHFILDLPQYSNKEIMRDRLTEALIPERGFLNAHDLPL